MKPSAALRFSLLLIGSISLTISTSHADSCDWDFNDNTPGAGGTAGVPNGTWSTGGATRSTGACTTGFVVETSDTRTDPWTPAASGTGAGFVEITGNQVKYTFLAGPEIRPPQSCNLPMILMKMPTIFPCASAVIAMALLPAGAAEKVPHKAWTDPAAALREDPDFAIQGEYQFSNGKLAGGVQVIAIGGGKFDAFMLEGGLPGAGWMPGKKRLALRGERKDGKIDFADETGAIRASIRNGRFFALETAPGHLENFPLVLERIERKSPTLGAKPPKGAVVLFDGSSTTAWDNGKMENGHLLSTGATSKQTFGDYTLHLEFRTPYMPSARGQQRGNSGVYHGGRWETQVLDSFGLEGRDNECGGIYSISKPRLNMCLPPLAWQTYDVEFTAAKFDDNGKRTAWPRITVKLNGVVVHENLELAKDFTTSAPLNKPLVSAEGPVFIQNHNDPVVYRNIWIVPSSKPVKP